MQISRLIGLRVRIIFVVVVVVVVFCIFPL